ncbi:MAG: dihydrofolate reductase [Muribaculaceae bacterium]|nr:dihydrofolate reductase [Muribaculaceae bacterium]
MPHISIIVATARNNAIGAKGDLLYHISADLRRFKSITIGHPIIMGRKTFESFPNGPLPGRRNIVITRQKGYNREGVEVTDSLEAAIKTANDADEVMVIGGGEIYREAMGHADRLYLTEIDATCENADTFFPEIDASQWEVVETNPWETDARSGVSYRFITLERK